jgi:agarase
MKNPWLWIIVALLAAMPAVRNHATAGSPGNPAGQSSIVLADRVEPRPTTGPLPSGSSGGAVAMARDASSISIVHTKGQPGFWTLGQDTNNIWWFVSPQGKPEFLNTVTTVQPIEPGRSPGDPHFVSRDWDGTKAGMSKWAAATWSRVQAMGFKGLGAWSNPALHDVDAPMTQDLNIWACAGESVRFYNSQWTIAAQQAIAAMVKPLRDNRNLVGYYLDNELDWGDGFSGPATYFDHLPANNPNRVQVMGVVQELWPTTDEFNRDWHTHLASFDELDQWTTLPHDPAAAYARLASAWLGHLAADYFRSTSTLVRAYDPNHLILGIRYKGYAPRPVVAASRDWVDAQSINYYVNDARLDPDLFRMIHDVSAEPIIISEYSFHSLDGSSGDRDDVGFTAQVPDQLARAEGYWQFTTRAARVPYIIGADWFQWSDEPPTGRADGEDVNFGIVDIHDHAYPLLADAVSKAGQLLDPLHINSDHDSQADVWRDSYATKPVMHVPYLSSVPQFSDELSEWSEASRLPNVRRSQTVGLERSPEPNPSVYLGWNHDGLYMGLQVYNNRIACPVDKDSWWTRDYADFWVSTRPVASNQNAFDPYCHEFFFVPALSTSASPSNGYVGQWHRPGDALKDSLIPDTAIRDQIRILPDRYVLQLFIPAASLNGFDPDNQPAMAFNIHVRNFEKAQDYFWSAPKEMRTQERPSTWGTIYLQPPPAPSVATGDQAIVGQTSLLPAGALRQ